MGIAVLTTVLNRLTRHQALVGFRKRLFQISTALWKHISKQQIWQLKLNTSSWTPHKLSICAALCNQTMQTYKTRTVLKRKHITTAKGGDWCFITQNNKFFIVFQYPASSLNLTWLSSVSQETSAGGFVALVLQAKSFLKGKPPAPWANRSITLTFALIVQGSSVPFDSKEAKVFIQVTVHHIVQERPGQPWGFPHLGRISTVLSMPTSLFKACKPKRPISGINLTNKLEDRQAPKPFENKP